MNISPKDAGAELLIISQFTLYGDCRSRRPGFTEAARPETAVPLYELCVSECRKRGFTVATGEFGADMKVASVNDGPVTIVLDTKNSECRYTISCNKYFQTDFKEEKQCNQNAPTGTA
jgi:D-tyrosyl-tRNA(Tyr) deacylase